MTLRYACLADRLDRMPMVKLLIPFAAGIALARCVVVPEWLLALLLVGAGVGALLLRSSVWLAVMLLTAGFADVGLRRREAAVPCGVPVVCEAVVDGMPVVRGAYAAADVSVVAWRDAASGAWHPAAERVRLYADTLCRLNHGERLRFRTTVRRPAATEQGLRLRRRGYAGRASLTERNLLERIPSPPASLHARAVARMEGLGLSGDAGAVVRAMAAGDQRGVTPQLRRRYARSGMAHLLAVSGLHTGLLFLMVNLVLWWLPLVRRGHRIRNVAVIAAVWLFVAAAGFPASAVRAAVMCTMFQLSLASGNPSSGLNTLAAAAFGMLLWNPAWLDDAGFRLSFVSVGAILAWGAPLHRRLRARWPLPGVLDAAAGALLAGGVATLAAAPLTAGWFGVVSWTGIVVSPFVLLLAAVVVGAGALWLAVPLDALAAPLRFAAEGAASGIDAAARLAAALPGGAAEVSLPSWAVGALYALFAAATLAAWSIEPKKNVPLSAPNN